MDLLQNVVQHYAWGSRTAIPEFLGITPDGTAQAEVWMGAHPSAPSVVLRQGVLRRLDELIAEDPVGELGQDVAHNFGGQLPFLVKLLAAGEPLSLQAHPNRQQAQAGFARENAAGIALDAGNRLYKDANHKPEILCALTDFVGLCGFRPVAATVALLNSLEIPTARRLGDDLSRNGVESVVTGLLHLPPDQRTRVVDEVVARCRMAPSCDEFRWAVQLAEQYPDDVGVVVSLLLNLVHVSPGQALFLGAGNLHAYLGGLGVEVMANSDNVLRGGLTPKHVDVDELLAILDFAPLVHPVMVSRSVGRGVAVFDTPVPDFRLCVHPMDADQHVELNTEGPEIIVCTAGEVTVGDVVLSRGVSAFVASGERYQIQTGSIQGATMHRCTVG